MNIQLSPEFIVAFLFVFCRVGTTFMFMPAVSEVTVSPQIRLVFAAVVCIMITPMVIHKIPLNNYDFGLLMQLAVHEIIVGVILGNIFKATLNALHIAGTIVSFQSGFSAASMFDPSQGAQGSVFGTIYNMLFITLMLSTNLHHYLILNATESYNIIPLNTSYESFDQMLEGLLRLFADSFTIGVRFAAPFIIVGLIFFAIGGVLSKLMPQLQVFFILMPVQILLSFAILLLSLSTSMLWFMEVYSESLHNFFE